MTAETKPYLSREYHLAFQEWVEHPRFANCLQILREEYENTVFEGLSRHTAWRNTPQQASFLWQTDLDLTSQQRLFVLEYFTQKLIFDGYYRYEHKTHFQQLVQGYPQTQHRIYLKPLFRIKPSMPADTPHYGNVFLECSADANMPFMLKITANYYAQDGHLSFERLMQRFLTESEA